MESLRNCFAVVMFVVKKKAKTEAELKSLTEGGARALIAGDPDYPITNAILWFLCLQANKT